ncbi:unnamed protein product [Calicophoron daubneyi]|uniref:Transmembrane protein 65 n=1 Tax=Calicophoron daubneyi TaxID=300641 RepID=A0AAV2TTA9_CALDB
MILTHTISAGSILFRGLSTTVKSPGSVGRKQFENWAHYVARGLNRSERALLLQELNKYPKDELADDSSGRPFPESYIDKIQFIHWRQVFLANGLPFVAFGFLDNAIMIMAGEYIDFTLAAVFGLSTMAAAGLGNLVSDVCGIGTVGYVERLSEKMGISIPRFTPEQAKSRSIRWATVLGRVCGTIVGCLLGLTPLLWFDSSPREKSEHRKTTPSEQGH